MAWAAWPDHRETVADITTLQDQGLQPVVMQSFEQNLCGVRLGPVFGQPAKITPAHRLEERHLPHLFPAKLGEGW